MLPLLTLAAALAQVPEGVDVEDVDQWEAGAEALLDGPAGCWELVGRATWSWDFGRFGMSKGDAAFVGKMVDGVWEGFHIEPLGEITRRRAEAEMRVYDDEPRFAPMFGKLYGGQVSVSSDDGATVRRRSKRESTPGNLLRSALDELSTDVETAYAQWDADRDGVVYLRVVPLNDRKNAPDTEVSTYFADGAALPSSMVVTFPESFYRGTLPRFRVLDAKATLRGTVYGGAVFPEAEALSFGVGVLGFRFGGAQTIQYTSARRCEGTAPTAPEPKVVEPQADAPATDGSMPDAGTTVDRAPEGMEPVESPASVPERP